jgi:RHS repeat-associated protein
MKGHLRRAARLQVSILVAASLAAALLAVQPARAARPSCFGKRATIVGTSGHDRLHGTAHGDVISSGGGADVVSGRGGSDRICGSRGDDVLKGSGGADHLDGGPGPDTLKGGGGTDECLSGRKVRNCETFNPSPVDRSTTSTVADEASFLYTGSNPPQTGVEPGKIEERRVAIVRGRVLDADGSGLGGVLVRVLGHPELGHALTRENGAYDLAVNGGGPLTLSFTHDRFIPAQRTVDVPWQDWVPVDDVRLTRYDPAVTPVDLSSATPFQVARGSASTDGDGTRRATLLFPSGNSAHLVMPNGSTKPITNLHVRASEFTVGSDGTEAMPADLPPNSGYTYAVEFSADEQVAAGAVDVAFDHPVWSYTENFLGFPVGSAVPVGDYDVKAGQWVPADDGRVIKIVSITAGKANLDVDGDGNADSGGALSALGITDDERAKLATLYPVGQELWRVPVTHFGDPDFNWPYGTPAGAGGPGLAHPHLIHPPKAERPFPGWGTLGIEDQTLSESVPVAGTPFTLNYSSDRVPGGEDSSIHIPLSGSNVPAPLKRIDLEVSVAGRTFEKSFPPDPNQSTTFTWDGRDAYGRRLNGAQAVTARVGYTYDGVYQEPGAFGRTFGQFSGAATGDATRNEITLWQQFTSSVDAPLSVGGWDARGLGLGGWTLSVNHEYDPGGLTLYRGDGSRRGVDAVNPVVDTVAGNGSGGASGDGGPATHAEIGGASDVAVGPDGSLYIAAGNRIRKVSPNGIISTVAGCGICSNRADGIPATSAQLDIPDGVAVGRDGSLYIAEWQAGRIRQVTPDGIIHTVAGIPPSVAPAGDPGDSGDNGPATEAQLTKPVGIAVAPDGPIYVADSGNDRIRRIGTDGTITTVAGDGTAGFSGDGGPAADAKVDDPWDVAVPADGSLLIADHGNYRIRAIGLDGVIDTVAGVGPSGPVGDGGPATDAHLARPGTVAPAPDGSFFVGETDGARIRRVSAEGIITTVAGDGVGASLGDEGPAAAARVIFPQGLAVGSDDDSLYFAGSYDNRVRKISLPLQAFDGGAIEVPSEDGAFLYRFDSSGRQLATIDARTGANRYTFGYDDAGHLSRVTDADGNVTTIKHSNDGLPTAIVSPDGQRTDLNTDANGFLSQIQAPAGEAMSFGSTAGGLLTKVTGPRANEFSFGYDAKGRLTSADDPAGGSVALDLTQHDTGRTVTATTAEGRTVSEQLDLLPDGNTRERITDPDGTQETVIRATDGTTTDALADGTTITDTMGPDPRFGMEAPILAKRQVETPGGVTDTVTHTRDAVLAHRSDPLSLESLADKTVDNGQTWTEDYDASTNTDLFTSPENRTRTLTLDDQGRPLSEDVPGLKPTTWSYDGRGRLTGVTRGSGPTARKTTFAYGDDGFLASTTDPSGTTSFRNDVDGRATQATLPGNRTVSLGYDDSGNLTSVAPPGRPAHTSAFSAVDLPASDTRPDAGDGPQTTSYAYDRDRLLTQVTRPDGSHVTYSRDAAGRLQALHMPGASFGYSYDSAGRQDSLTAPGGSSLALSYDFLLPTDRTWSGPVDGDVSQSFDDDLRPSGQSVNGGAALSFGFDGDGLPTSAGAMSMSWDQADVLKSTSIGNVTDTFTHDGFAEVTDHVAKYNGSDVFKESLTYDKAGRVTHDVETVNGTPHTFDYEYDAAGRLSQVDEDSSTVASYAYDANGNRLTRTGGGTVHGTYNDQDELTAYGSANYTYDTDGRLAGKTEGSDHTAYAYDALGRLTGVTLPGGTSITYLLDGQGERIGRKVNGTLQQGFLYDDQGRVVAELDGTGSLVSRFVYRSGSRTPEYMVRGGNTYRIVADHLGSPRLVIDTATGSVAERLEYDEFGSVVQDSNPGFQPFGFAGGLSDPDTGLVRFGFRDYDPSVGRWTAPDPIGWGGGDPNLYAYVGNDPVSATDRLGLADAAWLLVINVDGGGSGVQSAPLGSDDWTPILGSRLLSNGDQIRTLPGATAQVRLPDGSVATVGPNTQVTIGDLNQMTPGGATGKIRLAAGAAETRLGHIVGGHNSFRVEGTMWSLGGRG